MPKIWIDAGHGGAQPGAGEAFDVIVADYPKFTAEQISEIKEYLGTQ